MNLAQMHERVGDNVTPKSAKLIGYKLLFNKNYQDNGMAFSLTKYVFAKLSDHKMPGTSICFFEIIQFLQKSYGDSSGLEPFTMTNDNDLNIISGCLNTACNLFRFEGMAR